MDRELTRAELDELLAAFALDAVDGEERAQVARYLERDEEARAEVLSLQEAAAMLRPSDARAPASLWDTLEVSLGRPAPPLRVIATPDHEPGVSPRRRTAGRIIMLLLVAAAIVALVVLGLQLARQQNRIDDLAAEMHRDPMHEQAMAARASPTAHHLSLDASGGSMRAEIVMLPDGTGYFMGHGLTSLTGRATYQLWAKVGEPAAPRMVSVGLLGAKPGIVRFNIATDPSMFEVTTEPSAGSDQPGVVVMRGEVS